MEDFDDIIRPTRRHMLEQQARVASKGYTMEVNPGRPERAADGSDRPSRGVVLKLAKDGHVHSISVEVTSGPVRQYVITKDAGEPEAFMWDSNADAGIQQGVNAFLGKLLSNV